MDSSIIQIDFVTSSLTVGLFYCEPTKVDLEGNCRDCRGGVLYKRLQMKSCLKRNNRISTRVSDEGRCLSGVSGRTLPKIRLYYLMTIFHDKMIFTSLKYWLTQNDITSSRPTPETLSLRVLKSFSVSAAFYLARSLNISLVLGLKSGKFCFIFIFQILVSGIG